LPEPRPPAVPLEAGLGPENPPCPACGEPLFGWVEVGGEPVRRCEACKLGVLGEVGPESEALAELERLRVDGGDGIRYRIANGAGVAASLGGKAWVAIEPGHPYLFTPEAVRRLASDRDQTVRRIRWRPGPSIVATWGTLMNSFTFGRDVALGALGEAKTIRAARPWQRGLDNFISVATAIPVLVFAVAIEAGAGLVRRGSVVELTLRLE
jgi:hypothetical protein